MAVHEAGSGPAVVLLHGFPGLALTWRHQIPALTAAGYRVIAPDLRGYGLSDAPDAVEDDDIAKRPRQRSMGNFERRLCYLSLTVPRVLHILRRDASSMSLQNRVTPFGDIVADPARGLFMGNRGILHDDERRLGASRWRHPNWVTCSLSFGGRKRTVMAPGRYTELFFLDEATALAAGHRPCAECRRADHKRFVAAWTSGHGLAAAPAAKTMDAELHRDRVTRSRQQVTFESRADQLPNGTMIAVEGQAWLVWGGHRHRWTSNGYHDPEGLPQRPVMVLTPRPTVAALSAGYGPVLHPSVGSTAVLE